MVGHLRREDGVLRRQPLVVEGLLAVALAATGCGSPVPASAGGGSGVTSALQPRLETAAVPNDPDDPAIWESATEITDEPGRHVATIRFSEAARFCEASIA